MLNISHMEFLVLLLKLFFLQCPSSQEMITLTFRCLTKPLESSFTLLSYTPHIQPISKSYCFYFKIYPKSNNFCSPLLLRPLDPFILISLLDCCSRLSLASLFPLKLLYGMSSTQQSEWTCWNKPDHVTPLIKILQRSLTLIKVKILILTYKALHDLTFAISLISCPTSFPLVHSSQTTLTSGFFPDMLSIFPSWGVCKFFLPGMLFLFTIAWLTSLPPIQMKPYQWDLPWHPI